MAHFSADGKAHSLQDVFTRIAPQQDLLNKLTTAGQDANWRRDVIRRAGLHPHASLLDLGSGTGNLARAALALQPTAHVIAADFTLAIMRAGRRDTDTFAWSAADALRLPFPANTFDAIVSGFLMRNVVDSVAALQEQYRVFKPRGRVVILDTTRPKRNIFSPIIWMHIHIIIPMLGRLLSGQPYLSQHSTEALLTAESLAGRMAVVGFKRIEFKRLMLGAIAIHWAEKEK